MRLWQRVRRQRWPTGWLGWGGGGGGGEGMGNWREWEGVGVRGGSVEMVVVLNVPTYQHLAGPTDYTVVAADR